MKKKIVTLMTGTMLVTSIGFAAPLTSVEQGQTNIGYNHYNLSDSVKSDSFYLEHGLSDKFTAGIERNGYSSSYGGDSQTTDVYLHYKLDKNVQLIVGDRNYSGGSDKMFYGLGATVNLAPKLDGYASVTTNNNSANEWQTGVIYNMDNQTSLHLGYKSWNQDSSTRDGIGFGIAYKL